MVISMSTMSGLRRSYSLIAVSPSPASPATWPPKLSTIRPRFLRAKTESSTIKYWTDCPSLLRLTGANCSIAPPVLISNYPRRSTSIRTTKLALPRADRLLTRLQASRPALGLQRAGHRVQVDNPHGVSTLNRGLWHSEYDTRLLALRNCHPTGRLD